MNGISYFFSDRIVLKAYRAKIINSSDDPQLFEMVQNLARRAHLPMPRIAIIPDDTPNAFATGRNPERAVVAVTEGIRRLMNREELEAVLAHELGHVSHRDILVGSIAAVLAQAIMFISRMAMWFGGSRDQEGRSSSPLGAIAVMILGPLAAMMLQMALSRSREFMADEFSATVTGRPDMLASALEKLENFNQRVPMMDAEPATAHMMIVNPLSGGGFLSLFSTHPPVKERIKRLRAMRVRG
jgi:heat shock protein HtpX